MSLIAVLNESIPHLSAAVFTQLVVFVWTTTQIIQTEDFRQDFFRLTVNGACRPNNLLGDYWKSRKDAEIASATLNGVGLFVTAFLTYKLLKVYLFLTKHSLVLTPYRSTHGKRTNASAHPSLLTAFTSWFSRFP